MSLLTATERIKKSLSDVWAIIVYGYEWIIMKLVIHEDNDARKKKYKKEHPEEFTSGKFKAKMDNFMIKIDKRHNTNKEQRMFIEALLMGHRYRNPEMLAIKGFAKRLDLRPIVRQRFAELARLKNEEKLADSLDGLNILYPEYVAMIKVAEGHRNFEDTYLYIIDDLQDRIKRKKAFRQLMIFPASALLSIVGMEVFVALYLIPEITVSLGTTDYTNTPTLNSYVRVREILLNEKMEYTLKALPIIILAVIFYNLRATKYLIDMILVQVPVTRALVTNWEISKFFNSLRGLLKSRFSVGETVSRSVDVVSNRVIKLSLQRDINANTGASPHLYDMFKNSVHINPEILNQLKIAKDNKSNALEVLDNVHEEFKDSMKGIMDKPADLVMPAFSGVLGLYIAIRLLPIYTEINTLADMMSRG